MLRVAFRADGGSALGMGHLSRCRSLLRELASRGPCEFTLLTADAATAAPFLGGAVRTAAAQARDLPAQDILVADRPGMEAEEAGRLRESCRTLAIIDDAWEADLPCDLRIIPNLEPPGGRTLRGAAFGVLTGGGHVILDPAFAREARIPPADGQAPRALLACFGGSDPGGFTLSLWPLFEALSAEHPVLVVAGPANARTAEILDRARGAPGITVETAPADLLGAYRRSFAALLSGGTQLYEACSLGLPAVIVNQNGEQAAESSRAAAAGAVLDAGPADGFDPERVADLVRALLSDPGRLRALSEAGRRLVDPSGVRKAADRLLAIHAEKSGERRS